MKKYLLAASAMVVGMSVASAALADSQANGNSDNTAAIIGNSSNDGDDNNDVDLLSGNSLSDEDFTDNNVNSNNDNNGNNRNNVNVEVDVGVTVEIDNSVNDSVMANQALNATVTDTDVVFDDAALQALDGSNDFNTGGVTQGNDSFRGFAGIATIAVDTSVGSNNQAATNLAAGADIHFE